MRPIIFGVVFGGETATGGTIENYPGYPEIDDFELMMKFRQQAEKYEVPIVDENIVGERSWMTHSSSQPRLEKPTGARR